MEFYVFYKKNCDFCDELLTVLKAEINYYHYYHYFDFYYFLLFSLLFTRN